MYPPLAMWARSNASAAGGASRARRARAASAGAIAGDELDLRSTYLMVPLRDVIDETYSAHLCVLQAGEPAPDFCR